MNFAIIGCAGYVAPRHLTAIKRTGNELVAALDPHDSVGILDRFFDDVQYFPEPERFDRHIEKLRRAGDSERIHFVSVCSPNYLHEPHVRNSLKMDADVICEKPLVIDPKNIETLEVNEAETKRKVYTILQLRYHGRFLELKERLDKETLGAKHDVVFSYISKRGPWYHHSWKGNEEKSGGLATNIGIHLFDILIWLFGNVETAELHISDENMIAGYFETERARIKWLLSIANRDLARFPTSPGDENLRLLEIDNEKIDFSGSIDDLHIRAYEEILAGRGLGLADARPSLELAYKIRHMNPRGVTEQSHSYLRNR